MTFANVSQLAAVLDSLPAGVALIGPLGEVAYINQRAALLDSDPPRALAGSAVPGDFPGWLDADAASELRAAVSARTPVRRVDHAARQGKRIATTVIAIEQGVLLWVEELADAEAHPHAAEGARDSTTGRKKHDLMQPLGAISNYAELIRSQSDGTVQGYASTIVRIATELAATIRRET